MRRKPLFVLLAAAALALVAVTLWKVGDRQPLTAVLVMDSVQLTAEQTKAVAVKVISRKDVVIKGLVMGGTDTQNLSAVSAAIAQESAGIKRIEVIIGDRLLTYLQRGLEIYRNDSAFQGKKKVIIFVPSRMPTPEVLEYMGTGAFKGVTVLLLTPDDEAGDAHPMRI